MSTKGNFAIKHHHFVLKYQQTNLINSAVSLPKRVFTAEHYLFYVHFIKERVDLRGIKRQFIENK